MILNLQTQKMGAGLEGTLKSHKLTPKQVAAIRQNKDVGMQIAEDFPEVADLYEQGRTYGEIVRTLGLDRRYGLPEDSAKVATLYAVHELLSEEDLAEISYEHNAKTGRENHEKGLAKMTPEQKTAASKNAYAAHIGKLTSAELSDLGKKGWANGLGKVDKKVRLERLMVANGYTLWSKNELKFVENKMGDDNYWYTHCGRTCFNYDLLKKAIYDEFGTERAVGTLKKKIGGLKEKQGLPIKQRVFWSEEEKQELVNLCGDEAYQHTTPLHRGKPNYARIQKELGRQFGSEKTMSSIRSRGSKLRKA